MTNRTNVALTFGQCWFTMGRVCLARSALRSPFDYAQGGGLGTATGHYQGRDEKMARRRSPSAQRSGRRRRKAPVLLKAFWVSAAVVVMVVAFSVGSKIIRPFRLWFTERQAVNRMEVQLAELTRDNTDLKAKREYLQSPTGAENEARRLGYVNPGEVSVVVQPPAKPDEDHQVDKKQPNAAPKRSTDSP